MMGANGHIHKVESVVNTYTKEAVMLGDFECRWWHKSIVNIKRYNGLNNLHSNACYQWISYDEIRNKILGMKQEKYGIWADIYATY